MNFFTSEPQVRLILTNTDLIVAPSLSYHPPTLQVSIVSCRSSKIFGNASKVKVLPQEKLFMTSSKNGKENEKNVRNFF